MKKILSLLAILLLVATVSGQDKKPTPPRDSVSPLGLKQLPKDKIKKGQEAKKEEVSITDYKIISFDRDTTYFDTTLTIQKDYKYNYLRKDDFELLPFSNLGQTYNSLGYDFSTYNPFPELGARAKHFNYMEVQDINYYHVPTPTTDLFFKTAMEQGQLLDAFITLNTSRQFNMSIAYKGLRSLGKYQHILTSSGNFRFAASYTSKDKRYRFRGHFVSQDILNEENGGVAKEIEQFESGDPEFIDRSRVEVNYENAENFLLGKRYFIDHDFVFFKSDSSANPFTLRLGHLFNYETKYFEFRQDAAATDFFGDAFVTSNIRDKGHLKTLYNQLSLGVNNKIVGDLKLKSAFYRYSYFFNSIVIGDQSTIPNRLKGDEYTVGAEWIQTIGGFGLKADVNFNLSDNLGGSLIKASAFYKFNDENQINVSVSSSVKMPNYNFLLYQSDYQSYNWYNAESFKKEDFKALAVDVKTKHFGNLKASYSVLDNYTYFAKEPATNDSLVILSPTQSSKTINYLKVTLNKEFKFWKFALNNTVMYQNVEQDGNVLNVPEFVTRNTFYYSDHLFKKAMYLQTGVTLKYFKEYHANGYNPLLGEFYVQDDEMIGGFPMLDFFVNAKIKQTRIYLKAEHFNSSFSGYDFYSAPDYPYRDFIVRFGLVWNFFR